MLVVAVLRVRLVTALYPAEITVARFVLPESPPKVGAAAAVTSTKPVEVARGLFWMARLLDKIKVPPTTEVIPV